MDKYLNLRIIIKTTALLVACLVISLSGCGGYKQRFAPLTESRYHRVYPGTCKDMRFIQEGDYLDMFFGLIDLPFSFALDTVLLPIDALYRYQSRESAASAEKRS